jgi:hypothetical protein
MTLGSGCASVSRIPPRFDAFRASPSGFHGFLIEQRTGRKVRSSTLMAQIVKIEEGLSEKRVLIRPDSKIEAALGY